MMVDEMELDQIHEKLSSALTEERYAHSLNVAETAVNMAIHYGVDDRRIYLAGLLHDCGKFCKGSKAREFAKEIGYHADEIEWAQPGLLHGIIGEYIARHEYGLSDSEVLGAIRWHTTGKAGMSLIEKIIYIADYVEPSRSFAGIDAMRNEAFRNLDRCIILCSESTIRYIMDKGYLLHPRTVETRNHSLYELGVSKIK